MYIGYQKSKMSQGSMCIFMMHLQCSKEMKMQLTAAKTFLINWKLMKQLCELSGYKM